MSNELPPPTGYATHNGMRSLQQDDATVLLYPHDYLIRPDQVPLYTADQMREYGRACERAAYERARHIVRTYQVPVGNSPAGEMACEWTMDALKEIDDAIAELGANK